jgi:Outer membrane lipoprotein-sorting protein
LTRRRLLQLLLAGLAMGRTGEAAGIADTTDLPPGLEVMRRVNARSRGQAARMRLEMLLRDPKRGEFRKSIDMARRQFPSGYRTSYRILTPEHEEGIGLLLSEDPAQRGMWMYFPAAKQLVRVASRGLSALASDFSCEDLLAAVPLADYTFRTLGRVRLGRVPCLQVEMTPSTERLRLELGFARAIGWVREDIWLIARADYEDEQGNLIKTFLADEVERIDGIWTARRFSMDSRRARHATEVRVAQVDYSARPEEERFSPERFHQ